MICKVVDCLHQRCLWFWKPVMITNDTLRLSCNFTEISYKSFKKPTQWYSMVQLAYQFSIVEMFNNSQKHKLKSYEISLKYFETLYNRSSRTSSADLACGRPIFQKRLSVIKVVVITMYYCIYQEFIINGNCWFYACTVYVEIATIFI